MKVYKSRFMGLIAKNAVKARGNIDADERHRLK